MSFYYSCSEKMQPALSLGWQSFPSGSEVVFHLSYVTVSSMILDMPLPAALEQKLKPQNAKLHFAVGAFAAEEVTLGHAADIAGISQTEFMHELSHRRIPMHYEQLEFAEDLVIIAKLNEKLGRACHQ